MQPEEQLEDQSITQKKITFANSEHISTVILILKECGGVNTLVGENEFTTIVNAVTLDAQTDLINKFIKALDNIKNKNFQPL